MAVVNVNNLNNMINAKDSRWLQLEVCREFQRSKCSRSDSECKFAHPPANVEVQNGRVIACYDSIKVRTNKQTNSSSSSLIVCFFSCSAEFQHGRPRERSGEEGSEKGSLDVPNDPLRWSCNWRSVLFGRGLVVVDGRL